MTDDWALQGTPVRAVDAAAYTIPADVPSADGTLVWDETTMVVVTAEAAGQKGLGWTYSAGAAARLVQTELAGVVVGRDVANIPAVNEALYRAVRNFGRSGIAATADRADALRWHTVTSGGVMTPDSGRPGLGLEFRTADAAKFRVPG
jgi:hypothetical protein